ncbi:hypothetical protein Btru_053589 [Bulinus truncatus]|nr:hypothetical protein Btru_053589 [Bulinus truncatus]
MQPDANQDLFGQAVRNGDTDQILWLLQTGQVDVNYRDVTHDLETPMMSLCHANLPLPPPASESTKDTDDRNSSLRAILEAVRQVGLRVDQQDALGKTLAMHACINHNDAMLRFAIERGCNPAVADRKGKNLMHYVAMSGSDVIASLVLDNMDVDQALRTLDYQVDCAHNSQAAVVLSAGYSPVDLARQKKHSALARQLSNALLHTKKDFKVDTARGDSSNVPKDHVSALGSTAAENSLVARTRPPLTRRDARMQVMYAVPVSDRYSSCPDNNSQKSHRSSTPPPTSTITSSASNGDILQESGLVRSVSLRRSYKVRRVADNSSQDNMGSTKGPPVQTFYSPLPSQSKYTDGVFLRKSEAENGKIATRPFPARPNSDQPLREGHQPSVVDVNSFLSPRPRHRPMYGSIKHVNLFEKHEAKKEKSIQNPHKADATLEETVSSTLPQGRPEVHAHGFRDELDRHISGHVTDRRTERRSSISLPDLRDMTGCLVTSRDALKMQDLAQGKKSRITLEDLDRRDNIKSNGTCADLSAQHENNRPDSSASDVSMDSNFEDEKPIRRT